MKIFSQSTACAFVAVANGLSFSPDADPDLVMKATRAWEESNRRRRIEQKEACARNPAPTWCEPENPAPLHQEFQLYGGWDLPVPEPRAYDLSQEEPQKCFMAHLPRRGQTGEIKRVNCFSNEVIAFQSGNGPTWFTGLAFANWPGSGYSEFCFLVKDGKFIPLLNDCRSAITNTNSNRYLLENKAGSLEEDPIPGDKYFY